MNRFKYICNHTKVGMAVWSTKDNRLKFINPAFAYIHGYDPEELEGADVRQIFTPECMQHFAECEDSSSFGIIEGSSFESVHVKQDGSLVPLNIHITTIKDTSGSAKHHIANIIDISNHKKSETLPSIAHEPYKIADVAHITKQHHTSQEAELFHSIVQNMPGFSFIYKLHFDGKEEFLYASDKIVDIYGIDATTLLADIKTLRNLFHPEDIPHFRATIAKSAQTRQPFHAEFRINHPQKGLRWLETKSTPHAQEDGSIMWYGITTDITDRKNAEQELLKTTTHLATLVNTLPDLVWMKDEKGTFLACNNAFEQFFGAQEHEIIGKTDYDFIDHTLADFYRQKDKEAIEKGCICTNEEVITYKGTGTTGFFETRKVPMYSQKGQLLGVLGIAKDITEQKRIEQKIEFLSHHDALTQLPNRTLVTDRVEQAIAYAKRKHTKAALMFVDLDAFKTINDSLGHSMGDALLKAVASRLKENLREIDTISRQGGDEFLIVLTDIKSVEEASMTANKLLEAFKKPFHIDTHTLTTSISIGIAIYPDDGCSFEMLLRSADTAMYKAKDAGRNTYCFFDKQMNNEITEHLHILNDLKYAIENNQFILHYQPQIDLANHRINGVEALIRWVHPEHGLVSPMKFIPIAESSGLIIPIGEWVIKEACRQAAEWAQQGIHVTVAVNISAVQFKKGNLEETIYKALLESGLPPEFLELEFTESILILDTDKVLKTVQKLKELGIKLSIDDFGTGYSSLSYLKRFSVDKLKIDQSFIRDIFKDPEDAIIIQTIIQMAKNLNLKTVAEGVETKDVLDCISNYGCDEVQGFYFAKPMGAQDFVSYFSQKEFHS